MKKQLWKITYSYTPYREGEPLTLGGAIFYAVIDSPDQLKKAAERHAQSVISHAKEHQEIRFGQIVEAKLIDDCFVSLTITT